jgi:hypothetical protein
MTKTEVVGAIVAARRERREAVRESRDKAIHVG